MKHKYIRMTVWFTPQEKKNLKMEAKKLKISVSALLRSIL